MAEEYPAGSIVRPKIDQMHNMYQVSNRDYMVVSEDAYYAAHPSVPRDNDRWVFIVQDNGELNGYNTKYFDLIKLKDLEVMHPEFTLDEIEKAQETYEAINGNK